ncbi:putative tyrosine-protein kinase [Apostichopus japonicus]|uniref:Putative tyrosine-protein kinase n=1 Tax=Stichopus japonicus TaxID=307972 RepID=A0A2G8LPI8_STIJA|nr:putative tyrosine-protein kinase [Apostichopus japonicus]
MAASRERRRRSADVPRRGHLPDTAQSTLPRGFTLSVRDPEPRKIEHYRIVSVKGRRLSPSIMKQYFNDLDSIVRHYRADEDGLCTRLGMPVHRNSSEGQNQKRIAPSHVPNVQIPSNLMIRADELKLGAEIGRGFFGAVYDGEFKGQKVAVKMLQDAAASQAFMEEAHIMSKLKNAFLVDLIGISDKYIVLEFMAKRCCERYGVLESHHLRKNLAARNILISSDDVAKVSDFGMAQGDGANLVGGKIPVKWTAPEAIRQKIFTNKSDVWSFGVLLWEMYSFGKVPYPRIPADEVISFLEEGSRMPIPEDCPKAMYKIMMECWEWEATKKTKVF